MEREAHAYLCPTVHTYTHQASRPSKLHKTLNYEETFGCSSYGKSTNKEQLCVTCNTTLTEATMTSTEGPTTSSVFGRVLWLSWIIIHKSLEAPATLHSAPVVAVCGLVGALTNPLATANQKESCCKETKLHGKPAQLAESAGTRVGETKESFERTQNAQAKNTG